MYKLINILISVINTGKVVKLFRHILHPKGIHWHKCGSKKIKRKNSKNKFPRYYECECGKYFSELYGTLLSYCKIDIRKVFLILVFLDLKFSFHRLSKLLGLTYKTVYLLGMKILKDLHSKREERIFVGENEIDEVYVTAGQKGKEVIGREARVRGLSQRGRGTYETDRPPILGIVNRCTHLIQLFVCVNLQIITIESLIKKVVKVGSTIYTDEYNIYNRLTNWNYNHKTVCHSRFEYAIDYDGDGINKAHCNTVEGLWSLLRQYLRQFRGINKENLKYYVNFFEYIYNLERLDYTGERIIRDMIM